MDAVRVTGLEELKTKLSKLEPEVKKEIKAINKDAAQVVADEAKVIVPVRTGRLERSIRAAGTLKAGIVRAGKGTVPYAGPIHFGVGARKGQRGPHNIQPNPFLYSALDKRRDEVLKRYDEQIGKVVDQVMN